VGSRPRAAISWSGGKDSLAALALARAQFDVVASLTMFDETGARSRSHGLRPELIAAQAERLGLRAVMARCSWATYNTAFTDALADLALDGVTHVIFGDLLFSEHREWAEQRCGEAGLTAVEPLFGTPTSELFDAFVASGATALLVTIREPWLDETWLGRPLGAAMKELFAQRDIDPCGERGEYHTAIVDSPLFSRPIDVVLGERVKRGECVALDLTIRGESLASHRDGRGAPPARRDPPPPRLRRGLAEVRTHGARTKADDREYREYLSEEQRRRRRCIARRMQPDVHRGLLIPC
jgi:diphthine-ammonia ligase